MAGASEELGGPSSRKQDMGVVWSMKRCVQMNGIAWSISQNGTLSVFAYPLVIKHGNGKSPMNGCVDRIMNDNDL